MADEKKFLDYEGLSSYHKKAKALYDETYAKKEDVKDVDLSNYVKSEDAEKAYAKKTDLATYPTSDAVDTKISEAIAKDVASTYAKKSDVVDQDTLKKVIAEAQHMKKEVVETLPSESDGVENVIYLVKKGEGGETNFYDEYLLIDGKWELIGNTETKVDLSNYPTKEELKSYPTKEEMTSAIGEAKPDIGVIRESDIDLLFKDLPEGFVPYPANGLYPSPDNYLRVWAGEELIAEEESPTKIEVGAYADKGVTRAEIPDSVTGISTGSFRKNKLISLIMPNCITYTGGQAFAHNQLTSATMSNSLTFIGPESFDENQLTSLNIPDSVTKVSQSAFRGNPLKTVSISRKTRFEDESFPENAEIIYRD